MQVTHYTRNPSPWPWVLGGVAAAVLVGGVVLWRLGRFTNKAFYEPGDRVSLPQGASFVVRVPRSVTHGDATTPPWILTQGRSAGLESALSNIPELVHIASNQGYAAIEGPYTDAVFSIPSAPFDYDVKLAWEVPETALATDPITVFAWKA